MLHKLTLIAVAVLVAGCSDPKAANEKNFQSALQSYLDTVYPKCYFNQKFPTTVEFDIGGSRAILQALVKAGLVSEKEESRKEVNDIFGGAKKILVKTSFDLTDEGRKFYKPDVVKTIGGDSMGGFCLGKATVKAVTQFSEPSDMFGQKISRVNYTYVVSDLPTWAKSPEMLSAIQALKADAESDATPVRSCKKLTSRFRARVLSKLSDQVEDIPCSSTSDALERAMSSAAVHRCQGPPGQAEGTHPAQALHHPMNVRLSRLAEQPRRWYAAVESNRLGQGGAP